MAAKTSIAGSANLKGKLIYLNIHTEQKGEPEKEEFRVTEFSITTHAIQASLFNVQRDQLYKLMTTDPKTVIPNHQMSMAVIYNVLLKSLVGDAESANVKISKSEELVIKAAPALKIFGATLQCEFVYKFSVAQISETEYVKVKFWEIEKRFCDLKNDLHKRVELENGLSKRLQALESRVAEPASFDKQKQRLQLVEERLDELTAISDHKQLEVLEEQCAKIEAQFDVWRDPSVMEVDNCTKIHTSDGNWHTVPVSYIMNNEEAIRCRFQVLDYSQTHSYMVGVISNTFNKYVGGYPANGGHGWAVHMYNAGNNSVSKSYARNGTFNAENNLPKLVTGSIVSIDFLPKEKQIKYSIDDKPMASLTKCTFDAKSYKFSVSIAAAGKTIRLLSLKRL
jgi:hypothetical protein